MKASLRKIYNEHYKNLMSYSTFRLLFLQHLQDFRDIEIVKFKRKTSYNINNVSDFVDTFNNLVQIKKL